MIAGLPLDTTEDELKALGAAAAASGAIAMFHAVGITPEARSLDVALGSCEPQSTLHVSAAQLVETRARLNRARAGDAIAAVSVGTPHFSLSEFTNLNGF